jgi:hypothetical protein
MLVRISYNVKVMSSAHTEGIVSNVGLTAIKGSATQMHTLAHPRANITSSHYRDICNH